MIGRTRHVTSPIWSRIDWVSGPKIRIVGQSIAELEMDKTVQLKLYLPLSGEINMNFKRIYFNILTHLISMDQQSGGKFK